MITKKGILFFVAVAVLAVAVSCSPKKNTAASRKYQAFITRYNIYYNGDTHFKETLQDMEDKYEDDYSRLVLMHPIEAKSDPSAPQPAGNFDRSIEKAQKAIQLRSIKKKPAKKSGRSSDPKYKEWMKRDEYNPFLHNAWMMMGRSQYFNGDFIGSASTFFYISRHFTWLPMIVTESKLWQARSYVGLEWLYEAELIITRIKEADLTTSTLRTLYNGVWADFWIKSGDYAKAIPYLVEAIKGAKGAQKTRQRFLLGQLYARVGEKDKAYAAYKAAGSSSSASYRTKFNARIKQSEVFNGADIESEVKALKRMTRYDRNKEYLDQIYYAIGNLYLSRQDTLKAIENYKLAAEKSTRSGIDKAISQLSLGALYYELRNYEEAQPCYAEAVPLLSETYPDYKNIKKRSDVLDELAVYSQNVTLQDSLLRLAGMTPEQRMDVINKIIEELKKKEEEEAEAARREEYLANQAAADNGLKDNGTSPSSFNINTDNSWYFYNTATKNAGKTEFQRRWGSRKLEDNWRRRNKSSFSFDDFDSDEDEEGSEEDAEGSDDTEISDEQEDTEDADKASDPHNPEYYLAQIPETEEQKATAHEIIQEGLYNMGVILKDKLEDYGGARDEFGRLLDDYPDNIYRLDTYYNMYLMYMREGRAELAEQYRQLILKEFADSPYGQAMQDPDYLENLKAMDANQQALYDRTYDAYMNNDNHEVHKCYEEMRQKYPLSKIMPKFMFLEALAYVTERKTEEFNALLREMLERYPDTDITPIASAWLKGMAQGRQLQSGLGVNMRGMLWDMRLTNDSTEVGDRASAQFELNPDDRQLLIMTFDTGEVPSNLLLYEIARHNFRSFVVKDFDLEQMNFGRLGLIVIRDFANMNELDHYRQVMAASPDFKLLPGVRPVVISAKNFETMLSEGRSFDEYFRYLEEQNYIDAQEGLLKPEDIETLDEADEAAKAEQPVTSEPPAQSNGSDDADVLNNEPENIVITEDTQPSSEPEGPVAQPTPQPSPAPAKPADMPAYAPGSEGDDDDDLTN